MTAPLLDTAAWPRIQDCFHRALEQEPEDRARLLNRLALRMLAEVRGNR